MLENTYIPESRVAAALKKAAKESGLYIRKCHWEGRIGAPDYVILLNGRAIFVETKATGCKPRASQRAEFDLIRAEGCPVHVVDTPTAARELILTLRSGADLRGLEGLARRENS